MTALAVILAAWTALAAHTTPAGDLTTELGANWNNTTSGPGGQG